VINYGNQDIKTVLEIQMNPEEFKKLYQLLQLEKQNSFQWHTRQQTPDHDKEFTYLKTQAQQALQNWQLQCTGYINYEE
jgi:hypothetical protein